MTWTGTRRLGLLAMLGVSVPVVALVGRILYAIHVEPVPAAVLALDAVVLGIGTLGVIVMLGLHLEDAVARPLHDVQARIEAVAAGRLGQASASTGPEEIRRLSQAVDEMAAATSRRLHEVTRRSGAVAMGAVLLGVAQELSDPVTQMRLTDAVLRRRARLWDDPDAVAELERLARGIARLEDLLSTLRQSGGRHGAYEARRLVDAAAFVAQPALLACDLTTDLQATQKVACVPGDVVQALVALLQNAAESGGQEIRVATRDGNGFVAFEVEDNGSGLPEALFEHAADPFVTTKPGHTGLGLALAKRAAHANGGTFELQALEPGVRSVVTLPTEEADAARKTAWPFAAPSLWQTDWPAPGPWAPQDAGR